MVKQCWLIKQSFWLCSFCHYWSARNKFQAQKTARTCHSHGMVYKKKKIKATPTTHRNQDESKRKFVWFSNTKNNKHQHETTCFSISRQTSLNRMKKCLNNETIVVGACSMHSFLDLLQDRHSVANFRWDATSPWSVSFVYSLVFISRYVESIKFIDNRE